VTSQPDWQIVASYTDQASGKNLERPALRELRTAASASRFDLLLVYRVDRLSRNLGQLVSLIEEFKERGVGFRSATEPFDTANPAGRMLVQLLGSFAEFERASMMDRIGAGMERKAARGEWTGGTPPYGYRKPHGTTVLQPDPATAPVVVAIPPLRGDPRGSPPDRRLARRAGHPDPARGTLVDLHRARAPAQPGLHRGGELPGRVGVGSPPTRRRARPLRRGAGHPRRAGRRSRPAAHQPVGLPPPPSPSCATAAGTLYEREPAVKGQGPAW